MIDDPMADAMAALVIAVMHTMTDTQRKAMAESLASTALAAESEGHAKSAEIMRFLERAAVFVRHSLNKH